MQGAQDNFRFHLLNDFQRGFPVIERPFAVLAKELDATEQQVIDALVVLQGEGVVSRVGAAVRPNTAGASTLAAMAVPVKRLPEVTAWLSGFASVNHSYLREDDWNLWFVVTAPDVASLEHDLTQISAYTGLRVLDLLLLRPFHIDLGFDLKGGARKASGRPHADLSVLQETDKPLLHALSRGLPLVPRPYAALASSLSFSVGDVMERIATLCAAGIISRFGVIVRHRQLGWTENAMVVWDLPHTAIEAAGEALARLPGVSLCYQRRTVPGLWPYALYCMVHARTRPEAQGIIAQAANLPPLKGVAHKVLFSTHCYKQTGANLHREEVAA